MVKLRRIRALLDAKGFVPVQAIVAVIVILVALTMAAFATKNVKRTASPTPSAVANAGSRAISLKNFKFSFAAANYPYAVSACDTTGCIVRGPNNREVFVRVNETYQNAVRVECGRTCWAYTPEGQQIMQANATSNECVNGCTVYVPTLGTFQLKPGGQTFRQGKQIHLDCQGKGNSPCRVLENGQENTDATVRTASFDYKPGDYICDNAGACGTIILINESAGKVTIKGRNGDTQILDINKVDYTKSGNQYGGQYNPLTKFTCSDGANVDCQPCADQMTCNGKSYHTFEQITQRGWTINGQQPPLLSNPDSKNFKLGDYVCDKSGSCGTIILINQSAGKVTIKDRNGISHDLNSDEITSYQDGGQYNTPLTKFTCSNGGSPDCKRCADQNSCDGQSYYTQEQIAQYGWTINGSKPSQDNPGGQIDIGKYYCGAGNNCGYYNGQTDPNGNPILCTQQGGGGTCFGTPVINTQPSTPGTGNPDDKNNSNSGMFSGPTPVVCGTAGCVSNCGSACQGTMVAAPNGQGNYMQNPNGTFSPCSGGPTCTWKFSGPGGQGSPNKGVTTNPDGSTKVLGHDSPSGCTTIQCMIDNGEIHIDRPD